MIQLASWRSEGNFKEKCLRLFVVVVVMETMLHTCVPSFISMYGTVSEFGNFKEKCLRLFVVVVVMETM